MRKQAAEHRAAAARSFQAVANSFLPRWERLLSKHHVVTQEAWPRAGVLDSGVVLLKAEQISSLSRGFIGQGVERVPRLWPFWFRRLTRPQYQARDFGEKG